jgi:hypothetical protein
MVRALYFPALLLLAGCVSVANPTLNCPLVSFNGNPASLSGPVKLSQELEAQVTTQLPSEFRGSRLCWYISTDELVAVDKKGAAHASPGFTFQRARNAWVITDRGAPILVAPEQIE